MSLRVVAVDTVDWHEGISRLFAENDAGVVPGWLGKLAGAPPEIRPTSWIALDERDVVRLHVAVFPSGLRQGQAVARAGVMASIIADTAYRTGLPAVSLFRRLLADVRQTGRFDLLIGAPNDAARPLFRLARFADAGTVVRFVLPLAHEHRAARVAIGLWRGLHRYAAGATGRRMSVESDDSLDPLTAPNHWYGDTLGAEHGEASRVFAPQPAGPSGAEVTFLLRGGRDGEVLTRAQVSLSTANAIASIGALRHRGSTSLALSVASLAAELRRRGIRRVEATALLDSERAANLRRAGFLPRGARRTLLALAITDLGEAFRKMLSTSDLEHVDVDRW